MAKKVEQITRQTTPSGSALVVISESGVSKASTIDEITQDTRNDLQANIDGKVTANAPTTAKTATKITYDAKGLVTSGTNATTADINDTTDRRYVTDLEKTFLANQVDLFDGDGNLVLENNGAGFILHSPSGDELEFLPNDDGYLEALDMSGFVKVANGKFMLHGRDYKGVGFNYYNLAWSSKASIKNIMDYIRKVGGNEIRFWLFDQLSPSDSPGNFHFLDYPLDDPELLTDTGVTIDFEAGTTGWTLDAAFTRSSEDPHTGSWSIKHIGGSGSFTNMESDPVTVTAGAWYTLTFYYKRVSQSGFGPKLSIRKGSDGSQLLDGGLLEQVGDPDLENGYVRKQVQFNTGTETSVTVMIQNFGGTVTFFYDDFWLNAQGTPILSSRESQFRLLDFVFDEARKRGIRLVPVFADNTSNYNTKLTYVNWANATLGAGASTAFPYIGFFNNTLVETVFKNNIAEVLNRENTINGYIYKEDPTVKAWELGNELRADRSDPSGVNTLSSANIAMISLPGGWADRLSTYIVETLGAKQLVTYGSMSHSYEYRDGDSIFNGSYYGVDYRLMAALPYIHYLDFHLYFTQDALQPYLYPLGELDIVSYGQYLLGPSVRPAPVRTSVSNTTTLIATLNEASALNDQFVVHLVFNSTPGSTPVVTDNKGNTYTLTLINDSNRRYHYSGPQTVAGATTITATWTGNRNCTFYLDENSGRENKNNGRSRVGLEAQLKNFIDVGVQYGKPCVISEHGYSVDLNNRYNYHYPLQPRVNAFDALFEYWYRNGGAQINLWSATIVAGTSYSINLGDRDQPNVTDNTDDTKTNALIRYWNTKLRQHEVKSMMDDTTEYAQSELTARTFDGDYQGIVEHGISGEALTFGHLVYLDEFTSRWKKAGAALTTSRDRKLGMCVLTVSAAGESIKVLRFGYIRADSQFPTFTPGKPIFMSETAGNVSNAKPTTSGVVHRVVGYADSADQMTFQPDGNFAYVS